MIRVILFSMLIYLAGIAAILFLRPAFMFHPDGRWKEFGLNSVDHSPFPFWAFCLTWALFSFSLSRLIFSADEGDPIISTVANTATLASLTSNPIAAKMTQSLSNNFNDLGLEPLTSGRAGTTTKRKKKIAEEVEEALEDAKPGYYKLDKAASKRNGVPRYIYVGPELVSESEEEED